MDLLVSVIGLALLLIFCVAALVSVVFGMPGTFGILAAGLAYGWAGSFERVGLATLGWLLLLAVAAEGLEFVVGAGVGSAQRPSRRVVIATVVGGFAGGLAGAAFLLGFGALPGAVFGAFAGATLAAGSQGAGFTGAVGQGFVAARGRLLGFIIKIAIAISMTVFLFIDALR